MTDKELLRSLAESATPGPWEPCSMGMYIFGPAGETIASTDEDGDLEIRGVGECLPMEENAAFIAAANPTTILGLLAECERLRAENATLLARAEEADAKLEEMRRMFDVTRIKVATAGSFDRTKGWHHIECEVATLRADRDAAIALREDAETRAEVCEANHAGRLKSLGDEVVSLRKGASARDRRIAELMRERDAAMDDRDARPAITAEDAAAWLDGATRAVDAVSLALRAHAKGAKS